HRSDLSSFCIYVFMTRLSAMQNFAGVSSWPRVGLALVPATYREAWFFDPIPAAALAKAGLPTYITLGNLDESVWARGNSAGLRIVANHILGLVRSRL